MYIFVCQNVKCQKKKFLSNVKNYLHEGIKHLFVKKK